MEIYKACCANSEITSGLDYIIIKYVKKLKIITQNQEFIITIFEKLISVKFTIKKVPIRSIS